MSRPSPFQYSILLTLAMIVGVTLLCSLGFWQLSRAHQKEGLLQDYAQGVNQTLTGQALMKSPSPRSLRYDGVKLQGTFINDKTILLDNMINNGQAGYHVITPFTLDRETIILVNRGWIPLLQSRSNLPVPSPVIGEVTIEGYLDFAYRNPLIKDPLETHSIEWPLRMQIIDTDLLEKVIGKKIYPMLVTLHNNSPYAFELPPKPGNGMTPAKHTGYAVQWFSLAATLLAYSLFCLIRRKKT